MSKSAGSNAEGTADTGAAKAAATGTDSKPSIPTAEGTGPGPSAGRDQGRTPVEPALPGDPDHGVFEPDGKTPFSQGGGTAPAATNPEHRPVMTVETDRASTTDERGLPPAAIGAGPRPDGRAYTPEQIRGDSPGTVSTGGRAADDRRKDTILVPANNDPQIPAVINPAGQPYPQPAPLVVDGADTSGTNVPADDKKAAKTRK